MDQNTFDTNQVIKNCLTLAKKDQEKDQIQSSKDYLLAFHKSEQSWSILCDILAMESVSTEVTTQAAIFLKQKFLYDFYQFPPTEYWNMAHSIIRFLMKNSDPQVTKKLSRAFALLYLHAFETLGDVIEMLENTLLSLDEKKSVAINILRLLSAILYTKHIVISKKQKERYIAYIESKLTTKVFDILEDLGKNENLSHEVKNSMLQACNDWIHFSRKNKSIINKIHEHSCFRLALSAIKDPVLAVDARCVLNIVIKSVRHPSNDIYEAICNNLVEYIEGSSKAAKENSKHLLEYAKLFTTFGTNYLEIMVSESDKNLVPFIKHMKELTVDHELPNTVITELEEFWDSFPKDFVENFQDSSDLSDQLNITEFFKELIGALIQKMQLNPEILKYIEDQYINKIPTNNVDEDDSKDEPEEVEKDKEGKMLYKRILRNVQDINGFDSTFLCIHNTFKDLISSLNQNSANWENLSWSTISKLECILYAAKISISAGETNEKHLSEFLELIIPLKLTSIRTKIAKIALIECIATQLSTPTEELQSNAIYCLLELALDPKNSDEAGEALINVFEYWHEFVVKNFETFLEFRNKFERDFHYFSAMAKATNKANLESQKRFIVELCKPSIERFSNYVESADDGLTENVEKEILLDLKILGLIFAENPSEGAFDHPLAAIMQDLWPIFKTAFKKFYKHTKVLLKMCHVMKKCTRSLGRGFQPFMSEYLEVLCEGFKQNPLGSFLYGVEVTVSIFGKQADMAEPITKAYENISKAAVDYMRDKDMKEYNELFEDFFGMLFRFIKHMPQAVISSETFEKNFHLAELAIECEQPNIEKTVLLFLEYLFGQCNNNPCEPVAKAVTDIISEKYGAIYIKKLMTMFIGYPQELLRNYTLDVFWKSFTKLRDNTLVWFESAFNEIPESILSQSEKKEMLESLNKVSPKTDEENSDDGNDDQRAEDQFTTIFESLAQRCKIIQIRKYKFEEALAKQGDV